MIEFTPEQEEFRRAVARFVDAEVVPAAEAIAGADVANITTRAERRGDRWVLSGGKTWVTNAPVADVLTVAAKTSAERGMKNIALFLLDRSTMRGITLGKKIDKMSVRASETGEILLEDVEVPAEHLLGGETGGVEKIGGVPCR